MFKATDPTLAQFGVCKVGHLPSSILGAFVTMRRKHLPLNKKLEIV